MITYIAKFIICSGLLLAVYQVILSNERLYRFNRFYLLFSLIFSLTVPFITINAPKINLPYFNTEIKAPIMQPAEAVQQIAANDIKTEQLPIIQHEYAITAEAAQQPVVAVITGKPLTQPVVQTPWHVYLPQILSGIYGLVAIVLLLRFAKNSRHIRHLVGKNTVVNYQDTKVVLIDDNVTPHSFLKYVFINKDAYENGEIEPEIICHERAHIKQLHSLDIIFIELLQIVCWFNPFIIFYRRAIQLNHEFLADEAVIKNYNNTSAYQYLLLAKVSQAGSLNLTSQFNYQATKKRLIMMTKRTSAKIALYKKLAIIPFLAVAIFLFSQKSAAEIVKAVKDANAIADIKPAIEKTIPEEYNDILEKYHQTDAHARVPHLKISAADKKRLETLFRQMTKEEQQRQWLRFNPPMKPLAKSYPSEQQLTAWQDAGKYGVWLNDKRIKNAELAKYKASDFDYYDISRLMPRAVKLDGFNYQVSLMTKPYYATYYKKALADTAWFITHHGRIPDAQTVEYAKYGAKQAMSIGDKALEEADAERRVSKWPIPEARRIKYAMHDATPSVEVQYRYILKSSDIQMLEGEGKGKLSDLSTIDTMELHVLFSQMSKRQQDRQYVRFEKAFKPMPKNKVTQAQLQLWQDAKTYGVWIDEKRIKNDMLANYQPDDFDHVSFSNLAPIAVKLDGIKYQVNLMTKPYFANFNKKYYSDQSDKLTRIRARKNQLMITNDKIQQPKSAMSNVDKPQFHIVTPQEWKNIMGVSLNLHQGTRVIGIPVKNLKNVNLFISKLNKANGSDYRLITMPEFEYFARTHPSVKILKDKLLIIHGHTISGGEKQLSANISSTINGFDNTINSIGNVKSSSVSYIKITGEVLYPGVYASPKSNELAQEFIKKAGGITPYGSIENIQVFRAGKRVKIDFVSGKSKDVLLSGDSIYVPPLRSGMLNKMQNPTITPKSNKLNSYGIPSFVNREPNFVVPSSETVPPAPAKQDAPQNVLDEYAGILQRNHLPYKKGDTISFVPKLSSPDKARLLTLYKQMSDTQQKSQYIRFMYPSPPGGILNAKAKGLLTMLKNNPDKQFFIDGKKVSQQDLEKMPEDVHVYSPILLFKDSRASDTAYFTTNKKQVDYDLNKWVKNHLTAFYIPKHS